MNRKQFYALALAVLAFTTPAAFFGSYYGGQSLQAARADAPAGNGGPGVYATSPTASITVGGTAFAPTYDLATTQSQAITFTGADLFSTSNTLWNTQIGMQGAAPGACPGGTGTPTASEQGAICIAPTNTGAHGIVLGPAYAIGWACVTSCNGGLGANSKDLSFCKNNGAADACFNITYTAAGNVTFNGIGGSIVTNSTNLTVGSGFITANHDNQNAAGNRANRVTAAANSAVLTFTTAFTSIPVCTATDETTNAGINKITPTTTNVTVATVGATDVVDIMCVGNPS